jgi:hypothetical protein
VTDRPDTPTPDPPETEGPAALWSPGRTGKLVGFAAGALLLLAAIVAILVHREALEDAWASVRRPSPWLVGAILLLPALNVLAVAASMWALTRRYGRVGMKEMGALVAASWLLNYLPVRPGMIGRIAYHKIVNRIAVRDSVKVIGQSLALGAVCAGLLLAAGLVPFLAGPAWSIPAVAFPGVVLGAATLLSVARGSPRRYWHLATFFRYVDMLLWTARYLVAFALIGRPLALPDAVLVAVASQIALLVPFVGNGLGIREWAVGLTAARPGAAAGVAVGVGLAADLINRAAEVLVAIPLGLAAWFWITRRLKRGPDAPADAPLSDPHGSTGGSTPVDPGGRSNR